MSHRILIADDAAMNRMLVKKILESNLDYVTFQEAVNGKEVMEIVSSMEIDLIILDLIMPIMDGYEVLKAIKEHPDYFDIPIIVNSSIADIRSIEETLKAGAVDYFTKPLSPNDMNIILPLKARNALLLYEQNHTIAELNNTIQQELKNANTFANIMLPKAGLLGDVELYIKYHPSLGIGGDFFDCVQMNGRTHFMIADVTGHGIAAGMASSMVKILYRKSIEKNDIMPHEILEEMNRSIFEIFDFAGRDNYFVFTAFVGVFENGELYYSNAGHPYPMVFKANGEIIEIKQNGFLVGMLDEVTFETDRMSLEKKDFLFLYTDGLFCVGEKNDFTGWEKVFSMSRQFKAELLISPNDFLEEIFYGFHIMHKSGGLDFTDDVAMMLLKIN